VLGVAGRAASLDAIGGGSCDSLNWVNFFWLASSFRARAAAWSKENRVALESGSVLREDCVATTPSSLLGVEANVWPAPEL
jgi:F0F1-type ATP synthase assembly protein I